jgi:hypothetical protein
VITFTRLKRASFAHSTVYAALLVSWAAGWHTGQIVFGYGHGIGWFVMCALALTGLRRGVIPLYVAVCVAVVGAVGPFVGTASFIHAEHRKNRGRVQGSWP